MTDNNDELLGDKVEKNLKRVGADKIADAYQKTTKRDCGCGKRKARLNRLHESYRERRRRMMEQRRLKQQKQRQNNPHK